MQTSLLEAGITLMDFQATRWTMDKKVPPQEGNNHPTNTPMGLFPTADGFLNLAATSNKNFEKFCKLIDREKMATDPRFATAGLRARNKEALNELIAAALRARTSQRMVRLMVAERHFPAARSTTSGTSSPTRRSRQLRIKRSVTHPAPRRTRPDRATLRDHRFRSRDPDGDAGSRRAQ